MLSSQKRFEKALINSLHDFVQSAVENTDMNELVEDYLMDNLDSAVEDAVSEIFRDNKYINEFIENITDAQIMRLIDKMAKVKMGME